MTSVSVITNGNEEKPYFTDAVGKTVPRPFVPPQVASPINLLNPDRYEFYTFNDKGELIKRLMTLREIQSIVANGNGAMISDSNNEPQSVMLSSMPLTNHDSSDTKVQDIVDNVQNVLSREMENNKNFSSIPQDLLDTPNVSASWSMILPAIFGNSGDEILPHKPINMIPETEIIDTTTSMRIETTKAPLRTTKRPATKKPVKTATTTKLTQKVTQSTTKKPAITTKRATSKPRPTPFRSTSRRPSPVVIVNELFPIEGSDETTKTILITSRPFTTSTPRTSPFYQTTKLIPKTTTRRTTTVKKTSTLPPAQDKLHHQTSSSSLVKDTYITKIETKPLAESNLSNLQASIENESKIEKVTQVAPQSTTVLSTVSKIQLTSSPSTLPPTSSTMEKIAYTTSTVMMKKKPTTMEPSTSVSMTTRHPITITTEGSLKTSTTVLSPVTQVETTTERKNPTVEQEATAMSVEEEETTLANSEEIRQDLAINQIIGSLSANHFYNSPQQPHIDEETTTVISAAEEEYNEETTMVSAMDKSGNDINLIPDKILLDNQLYIDEKEPIVKEIPTTTPIIMIDEYTTTEPSEPIYEILSSTTMTQSKEDEISLENSEVMQTIEKLLQEQVNSKNKIHLQKLNVVNFDDDDETEIKLKDTLNSKEKLTHSEYITKAATVASIIKNKIPEVVPVTTTPIPFDDQPDTTISTILSEALSNVIEQMIRDQENRKTTLPATTVPPSTTTTLPPPTTTVKASDESDLNEPSLDELNKLLYHYQELQLGTQRNELESLSLLKEKSNPITTTTMASATAANLEATTDDKLFEETSPAIIMQKSKISNVQSIEFTTTQPEEELEEDSSSIFTTTEDPQEEFSTFFYVSDDDVSTESSAELGAFTTEQFVVTEKRISNRKDEEITTTMLPKKQSDEEEEEEEDDDEPADYLTKVLNAINSIGSGGDVSEEDNTSTEKSSNESDEIEHAITRISSTLDKTLKTDMNADFGFTSKIASSLVSVADTISESLTGGGGDNESEETTDSETTRINTVTPQVHAKSSTQKEIATTSERQKEEEEIETTTAEYSQAQTTDIIINEETTIAPLQSNNKEEEEKEEEDEKVESVGGPMIQLSIIRKEDSLEKVNLMSHNAKKASDDDEGNFIKIESIQKLSGFRNKTAENMKPTFITQRSTTTTTDSGAEQKMNIEYVEVKTERVPLIEKVSVGKESSTASIPLTTEENLVQIKVQTKPTVIMLPSTTTENLSQSTTISNAQIIKNSIKNSQQHQQQLQQSRPAAAPVELSTAPKEALGLAASTANLNSDLSDFSKLCNELAFTFWKSITADGISQSRSVIISPFALTSTLSMIFLGARGQTSGEMNDLLRLDDTVSFNPHVVFRNISESIEQSRSSGIAAAAFARELYSDRSKGKLLPYFKEKAQQFYGAHVEEVNFNVVNDILRRRTNLLVKKHTYNKIKEYLKTNNIWINEPLAAVSANVFMVSLNFFFLLKMNNLFS